MKYFFYLLITIFIFSCKKDSKQPLTTGITSSSVKVTDVSPDSVLYSYNQTESYSIDVNDDGQPDFKLSNTSGYSCAGGNYILTSQVQTTSNDCYILADSVYINNDHDTANVLIQTTIADLYPRIISQNDKINFQDKWRQGSLQIAKYYGSNLVCGNGHSGTSGYWAGQDSKYIGIRYKNLLGWIKIGVFNPGLKVYEFALNNK